MVERGNVISPNPNSENVFIMPGTLESLKIVARRLEPTRVPFAFLGGSVVSLLVDDPGLIDFRPTDDVDTIVEVISHSDLYALEEKLRSFGFHHDTSEGAPICRWIVDGCTVDIMPIETTVFGMNSRWFPQALATAERRDIEEGSSLNIITPPFFSLPNLRPSKTADEATSTVMISKTS